MKEPNANVVRQFLLTSKEYLTTRPVEVQHPSSRVRKGAYALIRSAPLQRPIDRRELQDRGIWAFAGRRRLP